MKINTTLTSLNLNGDYETRIRKNSKGKGKKWRWTGNRIGDDLDGAIQSRVACNRIKRSADTTLDLTGDEQILQERNRKKKKGKRRKKIMNR